MEDDQPGGGRRASGVVTMSRSIPFSPLAMLDRRARDNGGISLLCSVCPILVLSPRILPRERLRGTCDAPSTMTGVFIPDERAEPPSKRSSKSLGFACFENYNASALSKDPVFAGVCGKLTATQSAALRMMMVPSTDRKDVWVWNKIRSMMVANSNYGM